MRIVSLIENTTKNDGIKSQHGLSLYIETQKHKILFDMGQDGTFYENAQVLGIDLSDIDIAFISHGHYDHGGGLAKFFEINDKASVYIHKDAFGEHYHGYDKYIGLDLSLADSDRITFAGDVALIDNSLTLYSCNAYERVYEDSFGGLIKRVGGEFYPDEFTHEQYLLIKDFGKKVLISGCSHKGILNIMNWFAPDILVGGFHFSKSELDDKLAHTAKILSCRKTMFYTCHCTGVAQYEHMKKYMNNIEYLSCGEEIII